MPPRYGGKGALSSGSPGNSNTTGGIGLLGLTQRSNATYHPAEVQLREHLQPVLLHEREELERRPAWPLGAGFPLLNRRLARVQITGKDRLADMVVLAERLDLTRRQFLRDHKAVLIEGPHRFLVDGPSRKHAFDSAMDCFEGIALDLAFSRHGESPTVHRS